METFEMLSEGCLTALKGAIEFAAPDDDKKHILDSYHYAKDNAIAALGKVIKYQ